MTEKLTPEQIAEIQARVEAVPSLPDIFSSDTLEIELLRDGYEDTHATLMAAAHVDIPALLSHAAALEVHIDDLEKRARRDIYRTPPDDQGGFAETWKGHAAALEAELATGNRLCAKLTDRVNDLEAELAEATAELHQPITLKMESTPNVIEIFPADPETGDPLDIECDSSTITEYIEKFEKIAKERDELKAIVDRLPKIYNSGYKAGHHDTVEAQYVDIHREDMNTYHEDVVKEIVAEVAEETRFEAALEAKEKSQ